MTNSQYPGIIIFYHYLLPCHLPSQAALDFRPFFSKASLSQTGLSGLVVLSSACFGSAAAFWTPLCGSSQVCWRYRRCEELTLHSSLPSSSASRQIYQPSCHPHHRLCGVWLPISAIQAIQRPPHPTCTLLLLSSSVPFSPAMSWTLGVSRGAVCAVIPRLLFPVSLAQRAFLQSL